MAAQERAVSCRLTRATRPAPTMSHGLRACRPLSSSHFPLPVASLGLKATPGVKARPGLPWDGLSWVLDVQTQGRGGWGHQGYFRPVPAVSGPLGTSHLDLEPGASKVILRGSPSTRGSQPSINVSLSGLKHKAAALLVSTS